MAEYKSPNNTESFEMIRGFKELEIEDKPMVTYNDKNATFANSDAIDKESTDYLEDCWLEFKSHKPKKDKKKKKKKRKNKKQTKRKKQEENTMKKKKTNNVETPQLNNSELIVLERTGGDEHDIVSRLMDKLDKYEDMFMSMYAVQCIQNDRILNTISGDNLVIHPGDRFIVGGDCDE